MSFSCFLLVSFGWFFSLAIRGRLCSISAERSDIKIYRSANNETNCSPSKVIIIYLRCFCHFDGMLTFSVTVIHSADWRRTRRWIFVVVRREAGWAHVHFELFVCFVLTWVSFWDFLFRFDASVERWKKFQSFIFASSKSVGWFGDLSIHKIRNRAAAVDRSIFKLRIERFERFATKLFDVFSSFSNEKKSKKNFSFNFACGGSGSKSITKFSGEKH